MRKTRGSKHKGGRSSESQTPGSRAFQRRERGPMRLSPHGTAEWKQTGAAIQLSLRDSEVFIRCLGVETPGYSHGSLRDRSLRNFRKAIGEAKPALRACL